MTDHVGDTPSGYLQHALLLGLDASRSCVANIQKLEDIYYLSSTRLKPAPDGAYIIPHQKRNSPTNNKRYIISLEDPQSCVMLATLEGPIRIQLHTLINIRGTNHAQIVHLQINPHTRNILGRTYHHIFLTPDTQELAPHITPPSYKPIKGITGRWADKL
jgi:hypothetical protein